MSRSCFLSVGGDPFISSLVLELWRKNWYEEIDHMWICYNNHSDVSKSIAAEFLSYWSQEPKVRIIFIPQGVGNGRPITLMALCSEDELVMLLEDDGYIFTSNKVHEAFQHIEKDLCDALGSPRGSCGLEVTEAAAKKFNIDLTGYGDVGVNFWPNFFFCKRKDLLRTDLNFASKTWQGGEYSKELDHTFKEINHGDTFVWACVQLRALGVRFHNVPQFHASPTEPEDKRQGVMNWINGQTPYWIHAGSLSSGWGGYLSGAPITLNSEMEKREIETRCAFWSIASDAVEGFDNFKKEYKVGISNLVNRAGLDYARVQEKYNLYRNLMKI